MALKKVEIPKEITFLVLEDTQSMREAAVAQLRSMKFSGKIFEAEKVEEAMSIMTQESLDFVISDWNLPDGTGVEFLKSFRKMTKYFETPFLMVTTENEVGKMLDAVREGASSYLVKPWDASEFKEKVMTAWEKHLT